MTAVAEDRSALEQSEREKGERGGLDAVAHLAPADCAAIWEALLRYAGAGYPFTSDAVRFALPIGTGERLKLAPNAMGAIFRLAAKKGFIARTGESKPALHRDSRGRLLPLWRGVPK